MVSIRARLLNATLRSVSKPRVQRISRTGASLPEALRRYSAGARSLMPAIPDHVDVEPLAAAGVEGEWVATPDSRPDRVILFLHGGGYVMGSPAHHRDFNRRLAEASGARVLSVDYRLAPEHPFPAALEDALAAWQWLMKEGFRPGNIIISGDSAGGGLSLATLLSLRDSGGPLPAAAILFSPWTDLSMSGESIRFNARADPFIPTDALSPIAAAYTGNRTESCHPLVSPLFGNPAGFPPLYLHVGSTEVLLSDSTRLVEKAETAGVEVSLKVWRAMPHIFHLCACCLPEGRRVIEESGEAARMRFGS